MSVTTIKTKIRQLLGDFSQDVTDIFTYSNNSVFTLSESNPISITDVYRNRVSSGVVHSFDSNTNKVTITSSLTSGDTIEIEYPAYLNYSQNELLEYIQAALVHLSLNNYSDFEYDTSDDSIYPEPILREENLIAVLASIIIRPDNKSIRLPDVTINVPQDLPLNDKISKTIALFKKNSGGLFEVLPS